MDAWWKLATSAWMLLFVMVAGSCCILWLLMWFVWLIYLQGENFLSGVCCKDFFWTDIMTQNVLLAVL